MTGYFPSNYVSEGDLTPSPTTPSQPSPPAFSIPSSGAPGPPLTSAPPPVQTNSNNGVQQTAFDPDEVCNLQLVLVLVYISSFWTKYVNMAA